MGIIAGGLCLVVILATIVLQCPSLWIQIGICLQLRSMLNAAIIICCIKSSGRDGQSFPDYVVIGKHFYLLSAKISSINKKSLKYRIAIHLGITLLRDCFVERKCSSRAYNRKCQVEMTAYDIALFYCCITGKGNQMQCCTGLVGKSQT